MRKESGIEYPVVAGERAGGRSVETFDAVNPATEEIVAVVAQSDEQHVDDAVESARLAQREWMRLPAHERGVRLWRFAEKLLEQADALGELDTANTGKPIGEARGSVPAAATTLRYWAGQADKVHGDQLPVLPGYLNYTKREPLGVTGIVMPWNAPILAQINRLAPAFACGNGVVLKPSEYSPLSALRMAEIAVAAGLPAGLFNVVPGDGRVGAAVTAHPGIDGISFTGSVPTGRLVNESAARTFKKVVLELGGKSPNVVFADADLDQALRGTTWGVFNNSGQVCCAGTRLIVQSSIAEEFVDRLTAMTRKLRVGDPMDPSVHLGPVVCRQQYDRVQSYLDVGKSEAEVLVGGGRPDSAGDTGFFIAPTIFTSVRPEMRIAQEEIFGPVLSVLTFEDDDEALALANDTDYGLSAQIWTQDVGRALRMANEVEAGAIWVNTPRLLHPAMPFGGYKQSGLGNAQGEGAIEGNTKIQRVSIRWNPKAASPGFAV